MSPRIQAIVTQFVNDLTIAIQEEGAAAFKAAIGSPEEKPAKGRRLGKFGPEGYRKLKPHVEKRPKGQKRTAEEINELTRRFIAHVKTAGGKGQNVETIARHLGVPTKELSLPIQKAWDQKAIKTTGEKRGTKYYPK